MAQPSTSASSRPWHGRALPTRGFLRRNYDQGWEEINLLLALNSTRPVRYQFTRRTHIPHQTVNSAEGTICKICVSSQRGKTFITDVLMKYPKIVDYVFMLAPEQVRPTSRNTHCRVCGHPAFPELTKKAPTDEHSTPNP